MDKQHSTKKTPVLMLSGIALCAGLAFVGMMAYHAWFKPVSGYGQLQFGMQGDEVTALAESSHVCDALTPVVTASASNLRIYSRKCLGLPYGDGKRNATFTYIDDRLQGIAINLFGSDVSGTLQALTKKYGEPDSAPTALEKKQIDSHLTHAPVKWIFKGGQVMMTLQPGVGENDPATAIVNFESKDFETQQADAQE